MTAVPVGASAAAHGTVPGVGPGGAPQVTVVLPDAVPPGATVIGVVVLLDGQAPAAVPPTALRAVPAVRGSAGAADGAASPADPPPVEQLRPGLVLDRPGRTVLRDGRALDLTRREFDLLAHLTARPGRVLTRSHLLATVWGHDDPRWAGPRTVDVHVARLRRKLGTVHGGAVRTVRGVGYRWLP